MGWLLIIAIIYYAATQPAAGVFSMTDGIPFSALAEAIQTEEGYYPGSRAYRNNNPGNLRYAGQYGAIGQDGAGFAIFPDYQTGFNALVAQLRLDATRNPQWTLYDFISHYAPASDGNDPFSYVDNVVASLTGAGYSASTNTTLGSFS
ncbi:MAG: hypothetical protein KGJ13_06140 [Patescibacteria group bacterium]|nr:hypothetical protein [Patescibacteria group bacterium]